MAIYKSSKRRHNCLHPLFLQLSMVFIYIIYMEMGQNPSTPGEHQSSWDLWMFIPQQTVFVGIDP